MKTKNKISRFLLLGLIFFLVITFLPSCNKQEEVTTTTISIYTVNDFHGAIKDKAAVLGEYILSNVDSNSVVVSAGDMFQGSALSNYSYGKDVVNIMNMISFDSMTIGNHEFDWELDTVLNYFGNSNSRIANFPLLGCNVIDKRTNEIPQNMQAYQIVERGGIKIGIVGYVGLGLENDISSEMVENYEFIDPISAIKTYVKKLRTTEDVDIVIAVGHDASTINNRSIANLSGDERVDAIVNGHTHARTLGTNKRAADRVDVPYVQAGSSGEYVGKIILTYDLKEKKIIESDVSCIKIKDDDKKSEVIQSYVDTLISNTSDVFERILGYAGEDVTTSKGIKWACNAILKYCQDNYGDCDVAFTNIGGIREAAFPIKKGEAITYERIYQMMPFDNGINLVNIKGNILKSLIQNKGELEYSENSVQVIGASVYINGVLIDETAEYRVAVVDYIFNKDTYPFKKGSNIVKTTLNLREILVYTVEKDTENNQNSFI